MQQQLVLLLLVSSRLLFITVLVTEIAGEGLYKTYNYWKLS